MAESTKIELRNEIAWQQEQRKILGDRIERLIDRNDEYVKRVLYKEGKRFLIVDYAIITQTVVMVCALGWWVFFS